MNKKEEIGEAVEKLKEALKAQFLDPIYWLTYKLNGILLKILKRL